MIFSLWSSVQNLFLAKICPKMVSHGNRELKQLPIEPKRIARFFQIILEEHLAEGRLVIPRKFAKKYENDLLNEVFLEVPTGAVWKVELAKCDDRLWLQNGWRKFQEYYSIGYGTFLLFEYTSRSYFHVVICDMSASEIDYPFGTYDDCKEPKFGEGYDEAWTGRNGGHNESMEILNDCLPSSRKRKKLALPCPRPSKMGRTSSTSKSETKVGNENGSGSKHGKNKISSSKKVLGNEQKPKAFHRASGSSEIQGFTTLTSKKSLRVSEEAAGLKDENPAFSVVVKSSRNRISYAFIPVKFAITHLRKKSGNVILQISQRKYWNVEYRFSGSNMRKAFFSSGWYAFVRDNNLETGDVCAFELINRSKLVLKVVITRASKGKITIELKEKFLLSCPAGKTMKTATLDNSFELRTNVAHINHQLSCIKPENSTEDMHLSYPELQSEDTCKVKGESSHKHKVSRKNVKKKSLKGDKRAKALSKASDAFKSANPFMMIVMQPSYTGVFLDLPFKFAKRHFNGENGEIVLHVSDGRAWTVDYKIKSDQRRARFVRSWAAFVRDNKLAVGDVCVFELIDSTKIVLKVIIFRAGDAHPSFDPIHDTRGNVKAENITVDKEKEFGSTPTIDKAEATCSPDGNSSGKISVYEEKPVRELPEFPERPSCSWVPKVVEDAEKFTSMYPSFKVFIGISNLQGKVTVPAKFMKFIKQGTEKALKLRLRVEDYAWPVKLTRMCKIGKLTLGWNVFSGENQLQVGDCCIFELVDSESLLLKVSILRHNS